LRVVEVAVAALGLLTAFLVFQTAQMSNKTENLKQRQAEINTRVKDNRDQTAKLQEQVNNIATPDRNETARALSGTWKGEYRCGQGLTGLTLVIFVQDAGSILATFQFYPAPTGDPEVPRGEYAMKGAYDDSSLQLEPDYWIKQPPSYGMLSLETTFDTTQPSELSGRFPEGACKNWSVKKVSTATRKPNL
jgi:hypothetical protein